MAAETDHVDNAVTATVVSRQEYGVYCCGLIISCLILILIVAVIIVLLLVEGKDAAIILPVLLTLLVVIAIGAFVFMRWQNKTAVKRRKKGTRESIHLSQQQLPTENIESEKSSWAFWRKTSSTASSTGRPIPSAPLESANTSMVASAKPHSQGPSGYQVVPTQEITT